jgi:hypothetical protein
MQTDPLSDYEAQEKLDRAIEELDRAIERTVAILRPPPKPDRFAGFLDAINGLLAAGRPRT